MQLEVLQTCRLVALEGEAVVLCVPVAHSAAVGLAVVHLLLLDAQRFVRYGGTMPQSVFKIYADATMLHAGHPPTCPPSDLENVHSCLTCPLPLPFAL